HLAKRKRRFPSPRLAAPAAQAARVQDFRGNETSTACCHQGGWRNCAAFRARLERARILEEMRRIEGETFFHRLDAFLQGKPVFVPVFRHQCTPLSDRDVAARRLRSVAGRPRSFCLRLMRKNSRSEEHTSELQSR